MHEIVMIKDSFVLMWINFTISSIDLSDVENEKNGCYVGGNEEVAGDPIDRHHNQSPNVEDTGTNNITYWQRGIVDTKPTPGSDSERIDVGGSSQEGTSDIDKEFDPILWFCKIVPLLLFFAKSVSCLLLCL